MRAGGARAAGGRAGVGRGPPAPWALVPRKGIVLSPQEKTIARAIEFVYRAHGLHRGIGRAIQYPCIGPYFLPYF